ncbi:MAG: RNA polymerase subunit sigma-24 [Chlorobiaceae bacterium]
MTSPKKTPLDLLNDIYSIAWWMTCNEHDSEDLVYKTYLSADKNTQQIELLKAFRECYVNQFGQYTDFCISEKKSQPHFRLLDSLKHCAADIKFSVLLNEISGLQHRQISEIIGKPIETIRTWLLRGRQLLVNTSQLKASA